ncbi:MAG: BamA/TamA family outer membrane protein [Spirochaetes bacterium]|nr:BamA/TamA family outer membrane protein [Spirochaetota bacterium]
MNSSKRKHLTALRAMALSCLILAAVPVPVSAGAELEPAKENPIEMRGEASEDRLGFVTLPIIAYTPETTVMLGLNFMLVWNRPESERDAMPDLVNAFVVYSVLNQVICGLNTVNYISGLMMIKGGLFYQRFPSRFYGIGPATSRESREDYTPVDLKLRLSALLNPLHHLYMGPRYEFGIYEIRDMDLMGELNKRNIVGSGGAQVSGFGFEIVYDTKDNFFFPFRGTEIQLIVMGYHRYTGSGKVFYRVEFDLRRYFRIFGRHVVAFQYFMQLTGGDVPFQLMPAMGGQYSMRGYYQGRYRDRNYFTLQGEYRYPLFWRFSGVLFCGVGVVSPTIPRTNFHYLRIAWGGGLRLTLHRERMINLRFDFAVNDLHMREDDYGLYFSVMEAF